MRRVLLALVLLLVLGWFLLHTSWVQNWLVDKVAGRLSKDLGTEVKIDHIDLTLLNKMKLRGVLVRDKQKDTLLYAGGLHVNITDWFLFKREAAVLQYIGLEDAVVNLRRSTGPEWNYQFIVDHFSGPPKSKDTTTQQDGLQFDLKKAYLSNVRFSQLDGWVGKDLVASIKKMELLADTMDFAQKRLSIQRIELTEPLFAQRDYPGRRIKPTTTGPVAPPPTATAYRWNNAGWVIKVGELQLIDGRFVNEKQTDRPPFTDRFDGQHLSFNTINARLQQVRFQQDTLRTHITLSTQEKSGLNVKKLEADMRLTPTVMEFDRLDLRVNKSRLGDYYAMRYTDFNDDMADFLNSVVLEGRFQNSEIYSDDLAIFAPALKSWKRVFSLSGNARGSISNLSAKKMLIKSGNTLVDGDLTLRGLPNIQQTFIDFKGNNLQTNYTDLVTWIPTLKNLRQPRLQQLGAIGYRGNFTGFINDFVTYGTFNTGLGKIVADLNMKLPTGRPAIYSGSIATEGFQLGRFLEAAQLGKVSFNGKIKGTGFRLRELQANFDGQFKELEMGGQRYQNLVVSGDFENKQFRGTASINDPKLQVEELTGSVDFNGPVPRFDFDAWLTKAQLQPLGLAKEELDISGRFKLNFTGNNIDNFLGSARIFNASLLHDGKRLSFDSLALISEATQDGAKKLSLRSNEANADISGRFKILQLPDAFKLFLNKYYPAYIQPPVRMVTDQEFAFTINTGNVDEYVQLFDKRLKGFNNAEISGSVHLTHNELALTAKVPQMSYDGKTFTGIRLNGLGTADTLSATVLVDEVAINDSLHFPGTKLVVKSHNDVSDISLTTSASKTLNSAELYASVETMPDGVQIHFFPSSFIINEKKWSLEKDGELSLNKSYLSASGLKFVQGQQQITISTEPHEVKSVYNIVAKLTKVNVDDFAPFVVKKPRLEGVLDGEVTLSDPFGKPELDFRNTTIQNLRVDNNLIGNLTVEQGNYDIAKGIFNYKGKTVGANNIEFDGRYHTKDSTGNQLQTALKVGRINLSLLQPYLSGIFSDLTGEAVGELTLSGGKNRQYATGTLQVTNGSLKVNYTQCRYTFNNETILLNEDAIDFGKIELRDTLNNTAVLSGLLYHRFFQDFSFEDIRFSTNRLLLLNTGKKDNNQFYGKVIGNATLELNGPASNMRMDINGGPSTLESDSNHIYLPSSDSRETGALDYIDFIQFGSLMENELKTKEGTTILVDMNLTANPACKVDVILDEVTGDIIKGEGNGNLNIRVGNKENLSIRGRYDITQGEYAFNFQTVIKKPFKLSSGYINWTGNPYEADIKIDAEYLAPKVSLSTILASNQQSDIIIRAHLTETLKKPAIGFELLIPPTVDFSDKLLAERKLADFRRDPAEMNKQVSSLLIFGGFINTDQSLLGGSNPYNFAVGTIGQVLSSFLTNSFSRFLQKTLNDPNITTYFDITPSLNDVRQLQAAAKFGLVKTYLDNRLIITLGGNLDYNNPAFLRSGTNNLLITPDFSAEWLITRDGKLRVVGFRRSSIDQVLGQRNRQGISLTYKREFDGF